MQMLLAQWLAHAGASPLRDYAIHLLSQFDAEPHTIPAAQEKASPVGNLVEPLSQRELEVLHLIATGQNQPGDRPAAHRGPGHRQSPHGQYLSQAGRRQPDRGGSARPAARYPPLNLKK